MNDERRVWTATLKCPQGHAILAGADVCGTPEDAATLADRVLHRLAGLVVEGRLDMFCWVCYAPIETYQVSVDRTEYETVQQAEDALTADAQQEQKRLATDVFLRDTRN